MMCSSKCFFWKTHKPPLWDTFYSEENSTYSDGESTYELTLNETAVKYVINWDNSFKTLLDHNRTPESDEVGRILETTDFRKVVPPLSYVIKRLSDQFELPSKRGETKTHAPLEWSKIKEAVQELNTYQASSNITMDLRISTKAVNDLKGLPDTLENLCKEYDQSRDPNKEKIKGELGDFVACLLYITGILSLTKPQQDLQTGEKVPSALVPCHGPSRPSENIVKPQQPEHVGTCKASTSTGRDQAYPLGQKPPARRDELEKTSKDSVNWEQKYKDMISDLNIKEQEVKELKENNEELVERLSKEMGAKVSANESAVENISIKNRPMNIAEDYARLQTEEWFEALECIQETNPMDAEEDKLSQLCIIFQVVEEMVTEVHVQYKKTVEYVLVQPINFIMETSKHHMAHGQDGRAPETRKKNENKKKTKTTISVPSSWENLPVGLTNAVGDVLRDKADRSNYRQLIQVATKRVRESIQSMSLLNEEEIQNFIIATVKLCWKMAIQRPAMKFDFSKERFSEREQELYWGSDASKDSSICLVYPLLKHGDRIMTKGKMYLYKKTNHERGYKRGK